MTINLPKMAKKIPFQLYLELEQYERLKTDSAVTKVPISETIRQAIREKHDAIDRLIAMREQNAND